MFSLVGNPRVEDHDVPVFLALEKMISGDEIKSVVLVVGGGVLGEIGDPVK